MKENERLENSKACLTYKAFRTIKERGTETHKDAEGETGRQRHVETQERERGIDLWAGKGHLILGSEILALRHGA